MTPHEMQRLQLLLRYLIQRADDEELPLTITKLVKLLYLVDVEYYRTTGKRLTGLDWYFYYYGPYDKTIEEALSKLGVDIEERSGETSKGGQFRAFHSHERETIDLDTAFDWFARTVIDEVWRSWADADLNALLSHVYFETEPMQAARPMERLDFSGVRPHPRVRELSMEPTLSNEAVRRLRTRLERRKAEREAQRRFAADKGRPLADRLVAAYEHAVDVLQQEAGTVPTGLQGHGPTWNEFRSGE